MEETSSSGDERPEERDLQYKRFRKTHRLLKSSEFRSVFKKGRKLVTTALVFHVVTNGGSECRLGLAVSKKIGRAVKRNLVKRRIREAFREKHDSFEKGFDIVVYPRRGILDREFEDYLESFDRLLAKTGKKSRS